MPTMDQQQTQQRVVTREQYSLQPMDTCGGCLDAIAPGLDAYCPACTERRVALDPIWDAREHLDNAGEHLVAEIERATTPYRIEGFKPADVAAACEALSAACRAVLARAEEYLAQYGHAS